jgi:hypothetical protein
MSAARVTGREFARLEGCDEKQVRRAVARGLLVADSEGKLDPAQVGSGWRKPRVDSKERAATKPADIAADIPKDVRTPTDVRTPAGEEVNGVPVVQSAEGANLKRAVAHKEDFAGRRVELEYWRAAGALVEIDVAKQVLFDEFRAARDAWLNWPTRYAALIASELGVEVEKVVATLTNYVHKQLATLGEPSGEFRKG